MTPQQFAALQPGDVVRNRGSGNAYVVTRSNPTILTLSVHATNPNEWEHVRPPNELLATLRNRRNREALRAGDLQAIEELLRFADKISKEAS